LVWTLGSEATILLKNVDITLPLQTPTNIRVFRNDAADLTASLYGEENPEYSSFDIGTLAVGGGSGQG
jgi:beta-glucosidase